MKNLTVSLADVEGIAHGSQFSFTHVTVTARYTWDIILTDGTIIPRATKPKTLPTTGAVTFLVHASDDPEVREELRGFGVTIEATIKQTRRGVGSETRTTRTVKLLEEGPSTVSLGTLTEVEPVPPEFTSVSDLLTHVGTVVADELGDEQSAAYQALIDAAGEVSDPATAGLLEDTGSDTRVALDTILDDFDPSVDLTDYPTKGEVASDLSEYVAIEDAETVVSPIAQGVVDALDLPGTYVSKGAILVDPRDHGVTSDGTTDDQPALSALLGSGTGSSIVRIPAGTTRLGGVLRTTSGTLTLTGEPGAEIVSESIGLGVQIEPVGVPVGTSTATSVGATTVTLSGASMASNEHVGKWLKIVDPAINPGSGDGTHHWRRITGNTSTACTVEYGIGYPIPAGCAAEVVTPLERVELRDLALRSTAAGGALLVIRAAREVIVDNVKIRDAGDYAAGRGNGMAIYHSDRVRVSDCDIRRSGSFGMIVYNCDDVRVTDTTAYSWGSQFGIQLKDCRGGVISSCTAFGDDVKSDDGINIKCSGLNPSYDVQILDCQTGYTTKSGYQFSSITTEGTGYTAQNYRASGCSHRGGDGNGFMTISDAGSVDKVAGWSFESCRVTDTRTTGFSLTTPRVALTDCSAQGTGFEGIHVSADDISISGGTIQDCSQRYTSGAARSSEILLQGGRGRVFGVRFIRTTAGKTIRAVRDVAGATHNTVQDCVISDYAGGYSQDYVVTQAGDTAIGRAAGDYFAGSTTINKRTYTLT